ncbi:MAG: hypothetical protein JWM36_1859 [Hyphomicrobiales bacterium]|nr:hypothetical protein [Hyphomicrobiales bacterium]
MPNLRDSLIAKGLTSSDIAWFDAIDWNPSSVPPAEPVIIADYQRREQALNATVDGLSFAERGESQAGRLAAAIGARIADLTDPEEEKEE